MIKFYDSTMVGAPSISATKGDLPTALAQLIQGFGSATVATLDITDNVATAYVTGGHNLTMRGSRGPVVEFSGITNYTEMNGLEYEAIVSDANTFSVTTTGLTNGSATGTVTIKRSGIGLTEVFTGTNKAAYTFNSPMSTGAYYKIDHDVAGHAFHMFMYESMTDIDTGVNGNTGYYIYVNSAAGSTPLPWTLFCSENCVHMFINTSINYGGILSFGDLITPISTDSYHSFLRAYNTGSYGAVTSNTYVTRKGDQTGTIASYAAPPLTGSYLTPSGIPRPNPNGGKDILTDIELVSISEYRGRVPGIKALFMISSGVVDWEFIPIDEVPDREFVAQKCHTGAMVIDLTGPWV